MLENINEILNQCIPALTVIVLVLLIIVCIRFIILLVDINKITKKLNGTVDIVNDYLTEMKVPVRVLVNVSMSIEALRAASEDTVRRLADSVSEQLRVLTEWLKNFWDSISQIKKETSNEVDTVTISQPEEINKGDL